MPKTESDRIQEEAYAAFERWLATQSEAVQEMSLLQQIEIYAMADDKRKPALADYMRQSETDPFLLVGPPAPQPGWVYRDFRPMPRNLWMTLLDVLGDKNIEVVAADPRQLPPNDMCRAQIWISPEAQAAWRNYLMPHVQ